MGEADGGGIFGDGGGGLGNGGDGDWDGGGGLVTSSRVITAWRPAWRATSIGLAAPSDSQVGARVG